VSASNPPPLPPPPPTPPSARTDAEATFLSNLDVIERIIASIARRNALVGDELDEFGSWTRAKLIEDDYAVIRKFGGRSSLSTFLTVVITNLYRDYRTHRWGRWRPSTAAKKLGVLAVRLETLLGRDGLGVQQAIQVLRSAGAIDLTDRELGKLAAQLPARRSRGESTDSELGEIESTEQADSQLLSAEVSAEQDAARASLERALASLPAEDQLIVRLRFWEGFSIADISRALSIDQKPLYRRLESNLQKLRRLVQADGLDEETVSGFL
jgi:RNA polymerase sigma factor (sigma-70 family)